MKLEERLLLSIRKRAGNVILRSDVTPLGSASQISEALKALQNRGLLLRIGTGIYAKTRVSTVTGAVIPTGSLETLAQEALQRLGVDILPSKAANDYNLGRTTQIPGKLVVNTGKRRIQRNITVGGRRLTYENDYSNATTSA
jgi:predicted transcriptional regulator of viral defense system